MPAQPKDRPLAAAIEDRIDEQLALLTDGIRDALTRASQIPLDYDGHGHNRSAEFSNAIQIAKTSGEIVLALGKLNGRFNHEIHVRRDCGDAPPPPPRD